MTRLTVWRLLLSSTRAGSALRAALVEYLRPEIINYEHKHRSWRGRVVAEILLIQEGYRYLEAGRDTIAVLSKRSQR